MARKMIDRYIVTDPHICHSQPTFRGTLIMVSQVLEQVASGMAWETIVEEWRGSVSKEATAEAVRLAIRAFEEFHLILAAKHSDIPSEAGLERYGDRNRNGYVNYLNQRVDKLLTH